MADVFRFHFSTKYFTLESIFLANQEDVDDLYKYSGYSVVEMFGYDIFGDSRRLDNLQDQFWENPIEDYITKIQTTKDQRTFVCKNCIVGPNVVEYIHEYGEEEEEEDESPPQTISKK